MAYNLLTGLNRFPDHRLSVVLLNEGRLASELRFAGLNVRVLDERHHSNFQLVTGVRAFMQETGPQIIHSHRYKENLLALLASAGLGSVPLVATQHGLPEMPALADATQHLKVKGNFLLMSKFFRKVVAVSEDIGNHLLHQRGFCEESVEVIHNGVPLPQHCRAFGSSRPPTTTIGSCGRLSEVKGYPFMVDVARLLRGSDVRFELAGDGPMRDQIENLVKYHDLTDRFRLRGHIADMASFYGGLDVYINTSYHEGIPMTILEAMARGVPIVATDVGGIREIVDDGVEGFLVHGRDCSCFAARCQKLVEDSNLRASMSRAAREKVRKMFSQERMVSKYYHLYRELLS